MSDCEAAPFQKGDEMEIVHMNGSRGTVTFLGLYGQKFAIPYARWGQAGEYKIHFSTGQLLPRKASVWRLTDEAMRRLQATRVVLLEEASIRAKGRQ